jgi:N utilization substance protein A
MVVNELRGEKIDIVPFSDDHNDFVMKALQPAKVKEVRINYETRVAEVIVPDFQLSLAIGKEGQNARLATRLTGFRIDIRSETEIAEQEAYERTYGTDAYAEGAWVVDPATGEQLWQPNDGSAPMTLEQWEAAQASVAADEVEGEVAEVLDTDVAEAVEEADEAIAEAQVDAEEAAEVEIDQADMSLGGEAVEGDDPEAPPAAPAEETPGE